MSDFKLQQNCYLSVTPEGAYHYISSAKQNPAKSLLAWILKQPYSPLLDEQFFETLDIDNQNNEELKELLYQAQNNRWIEALSYRTTFIEGTLENILSKTLPSLSSEGKVLLADEQGFYISACGFEHECAQKLSALSADLAILHERHSDTLITNLKLDFNAWGTIDAAGNSQLGFWPIFIGEYRFVLMIAGYPQFNQINLTKIVSMLSIRYG